MFSSHISIIKQYKVLPNTIISRWCIQNKPLPTVWSVAMFPFYLQIVVRWACRQKCIKMSLFVLPSFSYCVSCAHYNLCPQPWVHTFPVCVWQTWHVATCSQLTAGHCTVLHHDFSFFLSFLLLSYAHVAVFISLMRLFLSADWTLLMWCGCQCGALRTRTMLAE